MNFKIEDLIHFLIFGFLGLLGGTAKYLNTHNSKYNLKSYTGMVVTSVLVAIIVCFIVLEKTDSSEFLIAVGITSGYLGSRLFDLLAEWFLDNVEKLLNRHSYIGGDDDVGDDGSGD